MFLRIDAGKVLSLYAKTGLSQKQFCKKAGLAFTTFQKFFTGERVHLRSVAKLANALNVEPREILKE